MPFRTNLAGLGVCKGGQWAAAHWTSSSKDNIIVADGSKRDKKITELWFVFFNFNSLLPRGLLGQIPHAVQLPRQFLP